MTTSFQFQDPTLETQWRAILLFGRNVASYKFALASSLLELGAPRRGDVIRLEELAVPFAGHVCRHLKEADRQATSSSSRFLDACRAFNRGERSQDELRDATVQLGFQNVIDAFHLVGMADVNDRFFVDDRKTAGGIRVTDSFRELVERSQAPNLILETESRWRLVETAWELSLPTCALQVVHDPVANTLNAQGRFRRRSITRTLPALNGYQKGRCFYCFQELRMDAEDGEAAEVDHFLPHTLAQHLPGTLGGMIDGVWNLVVACADCNRGPGGKFDRLPSVSLLERLSHRNEWLIASHHPLRETLMGQTGADADARRTFLRDAYQAAMALRPSAPWSEPRLGPEF